MPEELQNLLKRIEEDGVMKAESRAKEIVDAATEKSESMIREAGEKSDAILKKAEEDAKTFTNRAHKSLEQAARDVVLTVGESIKKVLGGIVHREVSASMDADTLRKMLVVLLESYCKAESGTPRIDILLDPTMKKEITDYIMSHFAERLKQGIEIKGDNTVTAGFRVSIADEEVQHDFTAEAVTDALCELLRPELADIVRDATAGKKDKKKGS